MVAEWAGGGWGMKKSASNEPLMTRTAATFEVITGCASAFVIKLKLLLEH